MLQCLAGGCWITRPLPDKLTADVTLWCPIFALVPSIGPDEILWVVTGVAGTATRHIACLWIEKLFTTTISRDAFLVLNFDSCRWWWHTGRAYSILSGFICCSIWFWFITMFLRGRTTAIFVWIRHAWVFKFTFNLSFTTSNSSFWICTFKFFFLFGTVITFIGLFSSIVIKCGLVAFSVFHNLLFDNDTISLFFIYIWDHFDNRIIFTPFVRWPCIADNVCSVYTRLFLAASFQRGHRMIYKPTLIGTIFTRMTSDLFIWWSCSNDKKVTFLIKKQPEMQSYQYSSFTFYPLA